MLEEISLYRTMLLSRFFELKVADLFSKGVFYGTTHLNIGQEASHVGLVAGLGRKDWIVPTHRCHGFNVARGTSLDKMFSELFGSRHGVCRGLGGSMHMSEISTCNAGSSAIVGSGVPMAMGISYSFKRRHLDQIGVAIFGDGATSRGAVHESMNLASVWNIPVLFYLENNHYGMSAPAEKVVSCKDFSVRAASYGIGYMKVDGNDVLAVRDAVRSVRKTIAETGRPFLLEADTYRMCGHSKSDARVYRSREEEALWQQKDPIARFEAYMLEHGILDPDGMERIRKEVGDEVGAMYLKAEASKDDVLSIRKLDSYLFAPSSVQWHESGKTHPSTYRDAIREALDEILAEDGNAFMLGEDIGLYGGCFGVTGNLYKKHPDKVMETPVSEEAFTQLAVGASMMGSHPIVEIMYADFSTLASDALINHAAKTYFMSAGQLHCPMIYRAPIGSGTGHGSQHTGNIETMFLNTPGIIVVAPSDAYTAKALLKSANREQNPVLFFEHKGLYSEEGEAGDGNTFLPLKKAFVHGCGEKLLVISYSHAFSTVKKATRGLEDEITYIDLATINPLDELTIVCESRRIGRVLVVQDTPLNGSVADSVVSVIARNASQSLKAPVEVIAAKALPIPFSRSLERTVIPTEDEVRAKVLALLKR